MKRHAILLAACCAAASAQSTLVVPKDAGILLQLEQTLDTDEAQTGDAVRFSVAQDYVVNGRLIAKAGAPANGVMGETATNRRFARGGKLTVLMNDVELADGEMLKLDSSLEEGSARFGFALAGDIASLLSPVGAAVHFWGQSHDRGYEMVIPDGTLLVALPLKDTPVDEAKFTATAQARVIEPIAKSVVRDLTITGNVPGALVELDHHKPFPAPHTFQVTGGLHDVVIRAKGYDGWERAVPVEGKALTVTFRLDPVEARKK